MSYRELASGSGRELSELRGAAGPASGPGAATKAVEAALFQMASGLSQLKKLVDTLGTPKDTVEHRHKIASTNTRLQSLAKDVKTQLQGLSADRLALEPPEQLKSKRLLQDFASLLQDYKATQKLASQREAASLPRAPPPPRAPTESTPLLGGFPTDDATPADDIESGLQRQAQAQLQAQVEAQRLDVAIAYNEQLIEERDQGIADIQRQIGEVNEMFQDLAVLISDQGAQLTTVDQAIVATAERTRDGARELVKAERSQRAARNKCLCLWLVAAAVLSVLMVILFA